MAPKNSFKRCASATVLGIDASPVLAEAYRSSGIPGTALVGLARGAVRESLTRVKAALTSSGYTLKSEKTVINLLPAEVPKSASALDLALAMALLAADEDLDDSLLEGRRFFGELSLSGVLEPVRGVALVADLARQSGDREIIVPSANADEAAIIPNICVIAVDNLAELVAHIKGTTPIAPYARVARTRPQEPRDTACLSEVYGQHYAKRALEVAAAGGHNMLMIGPPGSGKTMLARRLPSIMPPLSPEERIDVMRIHSVGGQLIGRALVDERPFRSPHHTASDVALCGGGSNPHPGEVSLAHHGVLFLDELPEFSRRALEALREPLEEGIVHVSRAAMALSFPARSLLVAAMNPCPCGYYREESTLGTAIASARVCLCGFEMVQRYRSRISGPLLDRIDLHVTVDSVPYRALATRASGETSTVVRQRVVAARLRQQQRFKAPRANATMTQHELHQHVRLGGDAMSLIEHAIDDRGLSTRAITRALKVARTIADLDGANDVELSHVDEAISLRVLDHGALAHGLAA